MSYPQSGGYGYGQNPQGQQYGQPADYGQQYGAQYGQPGYDAQAQAAAQQQAQYQQQYQQQGQYGYGAPAAPSSPGLPANTPTILAAVIGALGVITLFCGFLAGVKADLGFGGSAVTQKLFFTPYATPWALISVAGVLALVSFLLGAEKWIVGVVGSLTIVGALVTIFQFATADGRAVGAIILLITSILSAIAGVVWLLIEGGQIKTADATAASAFADASAYPAQQQAAQHQAADYGYGYGQQAQQSQTPAQHAAAPQSQAQQAQSQQTPYSPGQYSPTQYGQPAQPPTGDSNATTAFVKPATDPGSVNPQSDQQ